jgi:hypothetical protein
LPVAIKVKTKKAEAEAKLTLIAAAQPVAMASNALMVEDEFNPFYMTGANSNSGHILRPPYDPRQLERLTQENNAIGACIDAMVVNIDGTGFKIEKEDAWAEDADEEEDSKAIALESFFKEPFTGMTMRRASARLLLVYYPERCDPIGWPTISAQPAPIADVPDPTASGGKFSSQADLADRLNVSIATLARARKKALLSGYRVGGQASG